MALEEDALDYGFEVPAGVALSVDREGGVMGEDELRARVAMM